MALGEKTGGRTKGTVNKITAENREKLSELLSLSLEKLREKINEADVKDLIQISSLAAKHTIPVPKEVDEHGNSEQVIVIKGNLIK